MTKLKNAISVDHLLKKKFIDIPLSGRFKELLGEPERSGSWFVYGDSGHGKTNFLLQLAKELASLPKTKVLYNTLEEGARKSMQLAIKENNMKQVASSFQVLDREPIQLLEKRLSRPKSAHITIIDSVQYTELNKRSYKELQSKFFGKKLFIFNSHAIGKNPVGAIGRDIKFDADIKIFVEGFCAFTKSRMNRGVLIKPYIIWEQGARDYWGDLQIETWMQ